MKKQTTRTLLFVLLIAASIASYAFLNVAYNSSGGASSEAASQPQIEQEDAKLVLPDVRLIKKLIENGKRFLPASQL